MFSLLELREVVELCEDQAPVEGAFERKFLIRCRLAVRGARRICNKNNSLYSMVIHRSSSSGEGAKSTHMMKQLCLKINR